MTYNFQKKTVIVSANTSTQYNKFELTNEEVSFVEKSTNHQSLLQRNI